MPGAQGLGQIIGPNAAASILGFGFGYSRCLYYVRLCVYDWYGSLFRYVHEVA